MSFVEKEVYNLFSWIKGPEMDVFIRWKPDWYRWSSDLHQQSSLVNHRHTNQLTPQMFPRCWQLMLQMYLFIWHNGNEELQLTTPESSLFVQQQQNHFSSSLDSKLFHCFHSSLHVTIYNNFLSKLFVSWQLFYHVRLKCCCQETSVVSPSDIWQH